MAERLAVAERLYLAIGFGMRLEKFIVVAPSVLWLSQSRGPVNLFGRNAV